MKPKFIIAALLFLIMGSTAEAQFLKKLKKKAEQAAERTILNKTDEIVTKKTEKTIDDVSSGDVKSVKNENSNLPSSSSNKNEQKNTANNPPISSGNNIGYNVSKKLPEAFAFDWEYKTQLKSSKDEAMDMNYLIASNSKDYFGMEMSSKELKGKGKMIIVMDNKQKQNIMFMDMSGQKMAQTSKMPEIKGNNKKDPEYSFKEIGSKTILGYESYGMKIENADYIATVYFTLDAPVSFSAFFAFANNKNAPKGFDPALLQVLQEDALIMEMTAVNKKKPKESFTMTAISLEQKETTIKTSEYQSMPGF